MIYFSVAFMSRSLKGSSFVGIRSRVMTSLSSSSNHHWYPSQQYYSSSQPVVMMVRGNHSQSSKKWLERQQKDPYVQKAKKLGFPSRGSFKLKEINEVHFPAILLKRKQKKRKGLETHRNYSLLPDNLSNKNRLIQPDMIVLDIGAAPGGWSLYASTQLNPRIGGAVVAVDLLDIDETLSSNNNNTDISLRIKDNLGSNFHFVQGDFTNKITQKDILSAFNKISNNSTADDGDNDMTSNLCIDAEEEGGVLDIIQYDDRRPNLILSDMAANFTGCSQTDAIRTINLCEQALEFAAGDCFDTSYSKDDESQGILEEGGAFLCKYFTCGKENEADLMNATKRAFHSVYVIKPKASRKESSEQYLLALDYNCK